MKKLIMIVVVGFISGITVARADDPHVTPPSAVQSAFESRFPNARVMEWRELKVNFWQDQKEEQKYSYVADFRLNGKKLYAYYSPDGVWKGTGTLVKWSKDLPAKVRYAWKHSPYAAWYILDLKKITTPTQTLYQMHLNNSSVLDAEHYYLQDECKLTYNENGDLIKKQMR
jgi:hypothetical protein